MVRSLIPSAFFAVTKSSNASSMGNFEIKKFEVLLEVL
jgi:hypothetical protein